MGDRAVATGMELGTDHALVFRWADGHLSTFPPRYLRASCRCAQCVHEWTGAPLLDAAGIAEDLRPRRVVPVGRYGVQVEWSDGHASGIYGFEFLREICPCCVGIGTPPP